MLKRISQKVTKKIQGKGANPNYAKYCLDVVEPGKVAGWVVRENGNNSGFQSCSIRIEKDGVVLAQGNAKQYRDDLHDIGMGNGCFGFSLDLDWQKLDAGSNTLKLFFDDVFIQLISLTVTMPAMINLAVQSSKTS